MKKMLLCTDLDRTLLPNGAADEEPGIRRIFSRFVERDEVVLAYVSGRSRELIETAIEEFDIPVPDFAIGDVGTTLYRIESAGWKRSDAWETTIAADWRGRQSGDLAELLEGIDGLETQEQKKQARFKLSFYVSLDADRDPLMKTVSERIHSEEMRAELIWSIDEERSVGLLDVLPKSATKLHAVRFLRDQLRFDTATTLFAGDSGNDLPALTSELPSVLVANASEEVRNEALRGSEREGARDRLHLARGFLGLNGNYGAGILEGIVHFHPDYQTIIERLLREPG